VLSVPVPSTRFNQEALMIFPKANLLSFAAIATVAAVFTACDESPGSPSAVTSSEARTDLQAMAAKVKYFVPQDPGTGRGADEAAKRGTAGAGAARVSACEQEATEFETWKTDSTVAAGTTIQYDTTVSYTDADKPICALTDEMAYQLTSSRSENDMLETHVKTRMDYPADFFVGEFRLTGSGTVNYKDGYLITITSMEIVFSIVNLKTYVMNLALEKGYTVVLQAAPGANLMGDAEPGPNEVAVSGPITKDGVMVGYFEVMGDDHVVIRDAGKAIIESHG
jgi:hypothetical protein